MKKFFMFFIISGIIIGIFIGIKNIFNDADENEIIDESENVDTNNSTSELNLPVSDIDTLNPLRTKNTHIAYLLQMIYEPLINYGEDCQIENVLASECVKKDDTTWIIRLRENVYWHGNSDLKLSSSDVAYTINLLNSGSIDSIYSDNVKNVNAVDVVDSMNLVITLKEPDPYFVSKLTFPIIPEYYFKNDGIYDEKKSNRPVGTGAYEYDASDTKKIVLKFNKEWWKESDTKLQFINLIKYNNYSEAVKGFKSSQVDMIFTNVSNWKENFGFIGINSYSYESTKFETIIPNAKNVILSESSVRKAILQAINRENIIDKIYDGCATIQDFPVASNSKYASESVEYNIEKSKQILINAGWNEEAGKWTKNGKTLSLTLLVPNGDVEKEKVAIQIKEDLAEVSINLNIKVETLENIKNAIAEDKFDLALMTLDIKNEYQIQELVSNENIHNYSNYYSDEMESIISKLKTSDGNIYDENMEEFKSIYKNEVPYIGLYFKNNTILTNKAVKCEYKSTAYEPYKNINKFCK